MERRRAACLRAGHAETFAELEQKSIHDRSTSERTLSALLIGVTRFFRDQHVFSDLATRLPSLHARRRRLNILCVACSDGQEPYSIAMLLADLGLLASSRILGIDRREDAIRAAHAGRYPLECASDIAADRLEAYTDLHAASDSIRIRPELRSVCTFVVADAFHLPLPAHERFDLILCRNLAIYLQPEASMQLWESLVQRLEPGGLLVVGKAERPSPCTPLVRTGPCIYQRGEGAPS
ncbi:MAG TPA: CheR family methyltransferase [Phycisphaerales bacterium]|nr:CheR family methyltransferase [Phycisphaerales bacterium]